MISLYPKRTIVEKWLIMNIQLTVILDLLFRENIIKIRILIKEKIKLDVRSSIE